MKKTSIAFIFLLLAIYPPNFSSAKKITDIPTSETILNYLQVENSVLKYELNKEINSFRDSLSVAQENNNYNKNK